MQLNQPIVFTLPQAFQRFRDVMRPDTRCQVCLSAEDVITKDTRDRLIQCSLCLSTIHQDHYGSELLAGAPTKWYCQRCQYLLSKDHQITSISCEYCPSRTGIMKMVEVDRKKLWVPYCAIQVHPQCVSWDYPVRSFTNQYFEVVSKTTRASGGTQKFWFREPAERACHVCCQSFGQFVKCRYYSCQTHYHVTCARKVGVVRELEKMLVQSSNIYIPVYCTDHLLRRVQDFKEKAEKAQKERNKEKANHLMKLHRIYQAQVEILNQTKKYEQNLSQMYKIEFMVEEVDDSMQMEDESSQKEEPKEIQNYSEDFCNFLDREMKGWEKQCNFRIKTEIAMEAPMEVEEGQQAVEHIQSTQKLENVDQVEQSERSERPEQPRQPQQTESIQHPQQPALISQQRQPKSEPAQQPSQAPELKMQLEEFLSNPPNN